VIAAMVRKHFNNRLRTFGIGIQEAGYDGERYQQRMVSHIETEHTGIRAGNVDIGTGSVTSSGIA
jgi:asparagine synthetase B (glutamine-hydrolysing)